MASLEFPRLEVSTVHVEYRGRYLHLMVLAPVRLAIAIRLHPHSACSFSPTEKRMWDLGVMCSTNHLDLQDVPAPEHTARPEFTPIGTTHPGLAADHLFLLSLSVRSPWGPSTCFPSIHLSAGPRAWSPAVRRKVQPVISLWTLACPPLGILAACPSCPNHPPCPPLRDQVPEHVQVPWYRGLCLNQFGGAAQAQIP